VPKFRPSITATSDICTETRAQPAGLVVFGASGDLTARKLLPSLAELLERDLLTERFYVIGCGRKKLSDDDFRKKAGQALTRAGGSGPKKTGALKSCSIWEAGYAVLSMTKAAMWSCLPK
jgi:glucose-6-phosphate 1-dehydrogenase